MLLSKEFFSMPNYSNNFEKPDITITYTDDDGREKSFTGSDFPLLISNKFVDEIKADAKEFGQKNPQLISDWVEIKDWLGLESEEITDIDYQKFQDTWKAYLAMGVAPSDTLQPVFSKLSKSFKLDGYDPKANKAPSSIMNIFDRLLASDEEIKKKKRLDLERHYKRFQSIDQNEDILKGIPDKQNQSENIAKNSIISIISLKRPIIFGAATGFVILSLFLMQMVMGDGIVIAPQDYPIVAGLIAAALLSGSALFVIVSFQKNINHEGFKRLLLVMQIVGQGVILYIVLLEERIDVTDLDAGDLDKLFFSIVYGYIGMTGSIFLTYFVGKWIGDGFKRS